MKRQTANQNDIYTRMLSVACGSCRYRPKRSRLAEDFFAGADTPID